MPVDDKRRKTALIATRNYINAAKDIIDVGVAVVGPLHPAGAVILGVAFVVKSLISVYGPDETNDVMDELQKLRKKADGILERMAGQFTAFKAFYSENQFWNDIPLRTSVLYQYMQEVRTSLNKEDMKEFRVQYEKHDPVELARRLNNQLRRDVMNPLEHAAKAEKLMTDETFKKWYELIGHVFKQLWEIELCAGAWIHDKSENEEAEEDPKKEKLRLEAKLAKMDRVKDMVVEIDVFRARIEKWEDEYEQKVKYWPDRIKKIVEDVLADNKESTQFEKAEKIAESLQKIHRRAEMFVMVFPNTSVYSSYGPQKDQLLEVKGEYHTALVYRSLEAHKKSESELKRAFTDLKVFHEEIAKTETSDSNIANFEKLAAARSEGFQSKGCGLLVFIDSNKKMRTVQVAWPNSTEKKAACGEWAAGYKLHRKDDKFFIDPDSMLFLFGGYK